MAAQTEAQALGNAIGEYGEIAPCKRKHFDIGNWNFIYNLDFVI
jgi:hypothetical protein